jgi:hypothetical protein
MVCLLLSVLRINQPGASWAWALSVQAHIGRTLTPPAFQPVVFVSDSL